MKIDKKLAKLLSEYCLDLSKAATIATFLTPPAIAPSSFLEVILLLTKGLSIAIVFLGFSWQFAKLEEKL